MPRGHGLLRLTQKRPASRRGSRLRPRKSRPRAKLAPVVRLKRARKRHRPIVLHEGMQAAARARTSRKDDTEWRAGKIVDEPSHRGILFHPAEEAHQLGVRQVMSEQRADHEMGRRRMGGNRKRFRRSNECRRPSPSPPRGQWRRIRDSGRARSARPQCRARAPTARSAAACRHSRSQRRGCESARPAAPDAGLRASGKSADNRGTIDSRRQIAQASAQLLAAARLIHRSGSSSGCVRREKSMR